MVDWKEVERLRSKGLDWSSIAEEDKVGFSPPEGSGDPGRALKTLYLNRKSQRSRSSRGQSVAAEETDFTSAGSKLWSNRLLVLGLFVAVMLGAWSVVALWRPSPFGALVTFYPDLIVGLILGGALLAGAFVIGSTDVRAHWMKPVAIGLVVGLVGVGLSGYVAQSQGYLNLQPCSLSYDGGAWCKAPNSQWTDSGKPVIFFFGSEACPYCSASSWAIRDALQAFGTLTGWGYSTSSPTDSAGPNTPEVALDGSSLASNYLSWDPHEDSDNQQINYPAVSAQENSYVLTYDNGESIPFVVFGATYMHTGTFIDPSAMCVNGQLGNPYTPSQVQGQITNQSGSAYSAIAPETYLIEAYFVKVIELAGLNPPASVTQNPSVQSDLQSIP